MDFISVLISIVGIHLMASISPGPDFVVVSQKTLRQGRKAGVVCGIGVCVGLLFHISYSLLGVTTAISHSERLTQGIALFGGSYLIFLGYKSIKGSFSKKELLLTKSNREQKSAFWSGFIVNIFNPKAAVYFISLFSMVTVSSIDAEQLLLLVVSIIVVQMVWYLMFISLPEG